MILTVRAGRLYFYVHGSPGHSIRGNVTVLPGASLIFQDYFPGHTINLNGTTQQTNNYHGSIGANPGNTTAIDNAAGVTVNTLFLAWNLELINGVITVTDPSGYFHVPHSHSYGDGNCQSDSYGNGNG